MLKPNILFFTVSLITLFFTSCKKYSLDIEDWSPNVVSPIINSTITIADLIPERGTTEYDENNLIHLAFRNDSIYTLPSELIQNITGINIDTVITIENLIFESTDNPLVESLINASGIQIPFPPTQQIPGFMFNLLNQDLIEPFSFQFEEFSDAIFSSGQLDISIKNNLPLQINNLLIKIIPTEGIEWELNISNLSQNDIYEYSIDLTGIEIESTNSIQLVVELLEIENVGSDFVEITPNTGFEININVNNVGFDNINLPLGGDTVDVDLALFEDFDSGLILEEPRFTIKVFNPFNLQGNISGLLYAYSTNDIQESLIVDLNVSPFSSSSNTYYEDDIGGIIALPPQILEYQASANMSFNSEQIIEDESLLLGVDIDFPLSVNAANLSLKDTIIFDDIDNNIERIQSINLHYNFINGFPLGTEFNLILHDSIFPGINIDTLKFNNFSNSEINIIPPAIVDQIGEVTSPVTSSGILTLTDEEISNLVYSNKMIIDINLSSSNFQDQDQFVKIYSFYECILKLGMETKLNIN